MNGERESIFIWKILLQKPYPIEDGYDFYLTVLKTF